MSDGSADGQDDADDPQAIERERRDLEARVRAGDPSAAIDLAALALEVVGDDDEEALAAAAELARDAIARCEGDAALVAEAWEVAAESIIAWAPAWDEEETRAAIERDLEPGHPLVALVGGLLAFYAGRSADAAAALAGIEDDALAAHYLGCALERLGRDADADRALARAAELDPERFVAPVRMSDAEFRSCVEAALATLPAEIRSAILEGCAIVVEDSPSDEDVADGLDPLNLGEFRDDLGDRIVETGEIEDATSEVVLYKKNLEKIASSREELIDEARITLFHEVGHALGFEEDGVDDLGLA